MNTSVLNGEKILLAREILSISDINVLNEVRHRLAGVFAKRNKEDRTSEVLNAVAGKWRDTRSAEEMVDDIYSSRSSKSDDELINILNS